MFAHRLVGGLLGLGQFLGLSATQLNVRFLIYYGRTYAEHTPVQNKLFILNRSDGSRPMVITRNFDVWQTYGACDGTVCRYEAGDYWPDGTDRLRIGAAERHDEWISVELEANATTGIIRLYVDTEDGALQGLYVEQPMVDSGTGGVYEYVDIVGGYFHGGNTADAESYFKLDELAIDDQYIGPPVGFVTTPATCGSPTTCDAGESCGNCPSDCPTGAGEICCGGVLHTGDCCDGGDCASPSTCVAHVCTAPTATCTEGATRDCYTGAPATLDIGACHSGSQTCTGGAWEASCAGEVLPATEHCSDVLDNDCDGTTDGTDSDCPAGCQDGDGDGYPNITCGGSDCDDSDVAISPGVTEVCGDRLDNDCDGAADNAAD
ncbi:MAG: putative metal-binding motif-containing protein, partial [Myxococcota bacterium]